MCPAPGAGEAGNASKDNLRLLNRSCSKTKEKPGVFPLTQQVRTSKVAWSHPSIRSFYLAGLKSIHHFHTNTQRQFKVSDPPNQGQHGRPRIGRSVVWSQLPPACESQYPWAKSWTPPNWLQVVMKSKKVNVTEELFDKKAVYLTKSGMFLDWKPHGWSTCKLQVLLAVLLSFDVSLSCISLLIFYIFITFVYYLPTFFTLRQ